MSAIAAYADPRRVYRNDGSIGPYLQQRRDPVIPAWVSNKVGKYAKTGAATGYACGGLYSLIKGLSIPASAGTIFGLTAGIGFLSGITRLGYNILKRYNIL